MTVQSLHWDIKIWKAGKIVWTSKMVIDTGFGKTTLILGKWVIEQFDNQERKTSNW